MLAACAHLSRVAAYRHVIPGLLRHVSQTVKVPGMGDSISEGAILEWRKKIGEFVKEDEVIAVIETDKLSVDINCPISGVLTAISADIGETVFVDGDLCSIDPDPPQHESTSGEGQIKEEPPEPNETPEKSCSNQVSNREVTAIPMSRMRQRIAERLKGAQDDAVLLTTFQEVDMSNLMDLRKEVQDDFTKAFGVKLGFMSAFIKASQLALKKMPAVNSYLDDKKIMQPSYQDISVAVATATGLMVPVVRDVQKKSLADLEKTLMDLAERCRNGTIGLDEMNGGTFTITNGGVFGSLMSTPMVNPPQSAILGMHSIVNRPIADAKKNISVKPMMYLALTYDHRIIDGREAVTFLKQISDYIQNPNRLLLEI